MLDGFNFSLAERTGWRISHAKKKQFIVCKDYTVENFELKFPFLISAYCKLSDSSFHLTYSEFECFQMPQKYI